MKFGTIFLTREIINRPFDGAQTSSIHRPPKDQRSVALFLGNITADQVGSYRVDGALAALGYHAVPPGQLPQDVIQDALRYRFTLACADPDSLECKAAVAIEEEFGDIADNLSPAEEVSEIKRYTDLAIARLGEMLAAAGAEYTTPETGNVA